jgi:hypothetical protein
MSDTSCFRVNLLVGSNYFSWRDEMEALLVTKDLWDAVEENAEHAADDKKIAKSAKARAHILMCVAPKLRGLIPRGTAKQAWVALETFGKQRAVERKIELHRQLASCAQGSSEKVSEYILRADALKRELTDGCGETVSDALMMGILLNGVGSGFRATVEALRCQTDLTLNVLREKLMDAEARKGHDEPSGRALPVHGGHVARRPRKEHRMCFRCGKKGHLKLACPEAQKQREGMHQADNGRCLVVSDETLWGAPLSVLFDTCASHHMCAQPECFDSLSVPIVRTVQTGGGEEHAVVGQGTVTIQTDWGPVHLEGTLCVPSLKANLCSWRVASSKGAKLHSDGDMMIVTSTAGTLFTTSIVGGLQTVQGRLQVKQSGKVCAASADVWHRRLGHVNGDTLSAMKREGAVLGMSMIGEFNSCDACFDAKQARLPFDDTVSVSKEPLALVHADVVGKIADTSIGGAQYVLTILDDCTRYSTVVCLASKATAAKAFIDVLRQWERQTGKKTKVVRTDGGTEFMAELDEFLRAEGIIHQRSVRYTPQQNGRAERLNRTLLEKTRAMLFEANLPKSFWAEAIVTANYLRNITTSRVVKATPYELFHGTKPNVSNLRVFGACAHVHVPKERRTKLDKRSLCGVFVGYEMHTKGWRILYRAGGTWKAVVSRDVAFDEASLGIPGEKLPVVSETDEKSIEIQLGYDVNAANDESLSDAVHQVPEDGEGVATTEDDVEDDLMEAAVEGVVHGDLEIPPAENVDVPRRSERARAQPARYCDEYPGRIAAVGVREITDEPQSLSEVRSRHDAELWDTSMNEEMAALQKKGVFTLVELPAGEKALPCRWVYKIKRDERGQVERYKARVVAKGFLQRDGLSGGLSSEEVFAPASNLNTLRVLLSLAAQQDYDAHQLDVKTAFLNGDLEEEVYLKCPPGFDVPGKVWKLQKALYGLRQAAQAWHKKLKAALLQSGFSVSLTDPCLYMIHHQGELVYLLVHVDDCLLVGNSSGVQYAKAKVKSLFDVKDMGPVSLFLGLDVIRDRATRKLWLGQPRYIGSILKQFGMSDCKPRVAPLDTGLQLSKDGEPLDASTPYNALVGSLLYLAMCTRPDITHAVGMLSRFVSDPRDEHWQAGKSVLRYLSGTQNLGLLYGDRTQNFRGYTDSDFAGDLAQRKSTGGFVFMYGGAAVAWSSKLQTIVATSTCEAELIAAARAVKEALYFSKLMADLCGQFYPITLCVDNQAAVVLLRNPAAGASSRTKHVDVCYHFARHRVAVGDVKVEYISTTHMLADIMTKQLPGPVFKTHRANLGVSARF